MSTNYINTLSDLRRYMSDAPVDAECYGIEHDELIDFATSNMLNLLREKDFQWGDDLNDFEISSDDFWACFDADEV